MGKIEISNLAAQLAAARSDESTARKRRIEIEEQILAQFDLGESQRMTVTTENGLKLTMQTGLSYRLAKAYPEGVVPVKKTEKVELDVKAYEELRSSNPTGFEEASKFVTVTPRKPSVSLAVV